MIATSSVLLEVVVFFSDKFCHFKMKLLTPIMMFLKTEKPHRLE